VFVVLRGEIMSELFTFTVEYSEESPHPEKIFSSIAKTIEGMQFLNDELIKCLDLEATNSLTLHSVEKGSIKVVLGTIIKTAENCEFTKEYIEKGSAFLKNSTAEVIKLIGHNKRPTPENITAVEDEIRKEALKSGFNDLDAYSDISRVNLLKGVSLINSGIKTLPPSNKVYFSLENEDVDLTGGVELNDDIIKSLTTDSEVKEKQIVTLMIKKVDLIGESKWQFKYNYAPNKIKLINAKIMDQKWLEKWKNKEISLKHGDSLIVEVIFEQGFNKSLNKITENMIITKVLKVINESDYKSDALM
jgi:hypothetical protein